MRDPRFAKAVKVEIRRKIGEGGVEVDRFPLRQVDEDQAVEHPDVAAVQPIVLLPEVGGHQARGEQGAVEPVAPCMVGAGEPRDPAAGLGADQRAAMPADVVERIDGGVVAAHDDDGFIADLEQEVVALAADAVDVARDQPLGPTTRSMSAAKTASAQ